MGRNNPVERLESWLRQLREQVERGKVVGDELHRVVRLLRVVVSQGVDAVALNLGEIGIEVVTENGPLQGDEEELQRLLGHLSGFVRNRVRYALAGAGGSSVPIKTLPQLVLYPEQEFWGRHGFGRKGFQALRLELARFGLHVGMTHEEVRKRFPTK